MRVDSPSQRLSPLVRLAASVVVLVCSTTTVASAQVSVLHAFSAAEGAESYAPLVQGTDGNFYGTTFSGGASGGTIFRMAADGTVTVLHTFAPFVNGGGSIDGSRPYSGLVLASDGNFYGMTFNGGVFGLGTVYRMTPAGAVTILHDFSNGSDGSSPFGELIQATDGNFYGTTQIGGDGGGGTIFRMTPDGTLLTLHAFTHGSVDGFTPRGALVQATDGNLYGTTQEGAGTITGTIFRMALNGTFAVLHQFAGGSGDGRDPLAALIQGTDGNFYGTTAFGGASDSGVVFKMTAGGTVTVLYAFTGGSDGYAPHSALVQTADGSLYGTTALGGSTNTGVLFRMTTAGAMSSVYSFSGSSDGANPNGALLRAKDGTLVGTTIAGGTGGNGTAFRVGTPLTARFIYPTNSAVNVDLTRAFTWTSVPNAQAYYLYIGTTLGAKDLVNTGEIHQTSYRVPATLPSGTTLYTRLWTKLGGTWRFVDQTFSAASVLARFVYPTNGATNVDLTQPFTWTSVPNVQAYYLYIGTIVGAKDLVNTGEIQRTSYRVPALPAGTLYARLWTKVGGTWRYVDTTFTAAPLTAPLVASLVYPTNGATNVDLSQPFNWTSVGNVQAYYLYVGSTIGAKDLVNTGEISQTSYRVPVTLPAGTTLYARLWTKVGGVWRYVDATFTAARIVASLVYPTNGATSVDLSQSFTWTSVANVQAYYLYIGSTPGAKDLVNTGEIQQTSYRVTATLPAHTTVYARLWTKVNGVWRYVDSTFTTP